MPDIFKGKNHEARVAENFHNQRNFPAKNKRKKWKSSKQDYMNYYYLYPVMSNDSIIMRKDFNFLKNCFS